ncbi:hypothetical protein GMORB2_0444 [Geosmithia morbida]|uniref:Uncharacterized protein n=1 Tax=Geosmithia morbida TaxID=1094350 RepID=A0A9P5D516_9HYPO|nr:uncharacterized protein GMORB2_0444 [Geosmithia morbida]KAF4126707.1 hypothetical protein GMORB2_0444 [Geosmithia morbida]
MQKLFLSAFHSAPFNLTREPVILPGISEDELCILREKAAASCIGVVETMVPRSPSFASFTTATTGAPPTSTVFSTRAVSAAY